MKKQFLLFSFLFVIFTNINITVKAQAVNVQDSLTLVDLYNSANGPAWTNHTNWLQGPVSTWYGIVVGNTRVTNINLGNNQLQGIIPLSITKLDSLIVFDLHFNQISGSIPSSVGNLTKLVFLDLHINQITGSIPSSVSKLINLFLLNLSYNQLSGAIPSSIGKLVNVYYLFLQGNELSGAIPSSISKLINLHELEFGSNRLSGSIPSSINKLINLIALNLANNQLNGNIPSSIGSITNLSSIDLYDNQLSGTIPSSLGKLLNLTHLNLSNNQLSGTIPTSINKLVNLDYLDFSNNQLSGSVPSFVKSEMLHNGLNISYNHFSFDGMEALVITNHPNTTYAPQLPISIHQNSNTLSVSAGGILTNNTYHWHKVGQASETAIVGDSVFHPTVIGKYYASISNSIATELVLNTDTIKYNAPVLANTKNYTSYNDLQEENKMNGFTVYPNPAKDILHVQSNTSASVSVINESGKVFSTKVIIGNGEFNIATMSPGVYFLKNNQTGLVKKFVIVK